MPVFRPAQPHESGESRLGVLWLSSAAAALVLCLTVSGTLSAWTTAVLTHGGNTAATTSGSVVLAVTGPDADGNSTTCTSSSETDNSSTCSINLFGSNGVDQTTMAPGSSNVTVVTVQNVGDTAGTLTLDAGACADSTGGSLCGKLTITVACVGTAPVLSLTQTLSSFAGSNVLSFGSALPSFSDTCTFTTALPATVLTGWSGQSVTQPITWTLTA